MRIVAHVFPRELFRKHGIPYDLAKQTKSELFRDLLPLLNSGRIVLPRNDRLQGQIVGLERRTSAVGRDTISHPDRGHDDVADAVAGAAALSKFGGYDTSMSWVSGRRRQRRRLAARPSSRLHQQRGAHPTMTEFCALSHAESARRVVQTSTIGSDDKRLPMALLRKSLMASRKRQPQEALFNQVSTGTRARNISRR